MKKLLAVLLLMVSVSAQAFPIVPALPLIPSAGTGSTLGAAPPVALGIGIGYLIATNWGKPVPAHLSDACQAKTIKAANGNYSFVSYDHCKQ